ncbi:MAG: glycosyltransferase family 4 protein [Pyrinomonadaceae bacterium]
MTEDHFDGGLANYLARVSRALSSLGHIVHVITLSFSDESVFEHQGVIIHRVMLRQGWNTLDRLTLRRLSTTLRWLNLSAQVHRKLKQLHREVNFDLVQYPNYSFCGLFSIPLLPGKHLVRASSYQPVLHAAGGFKPSIDARAMELLEQLQSRMSGNVFAPSCTLQNMLMTKGRLSKIKIIRTPFYIETADWDTSLYDQHLKNQKYLLYFGRFQMHKGFHTLVHALPKFLEQHSEARVVLVGRDIETVLASSMVEYARDKCGRFADRLIVFNQLPHCLLYPIIEGAKIVALPSLVDNTPNACLEAMGLGKVVIGTRGTSLDELITDGVNGFLVQPDSPEELAEKLIAVWGDPHLQGIGAKAREITIRFSEEKTVESLLAYYREVLTRDHRKNHKQSA